MPLFEKEVQKCTVHIGNELLCKLKKYESFGELYFETLEGNIKIIYDKSNPHEFGIMKNHKKIAKIYI